MNWFRLKLFLCSLIAIASASMASAQDWPIPASTPNTPVPCAGCIGGKDGKLTPGYPPVLSFVGRYADSEYVRDYQNNFRTARPRGAFFVPERNRTYLLLGSALAAYNTDHFFSRVGAHERLSVANGVPTNPSNSGYRYDGSELFLWWDRWFYAEHGSPWNCPVLDGQDRLWRTGLDFDDRNNCYLAYTTYGWGIVKDDPSSTDGTLMTTVKQMYPLDISPSSIVAVKTSDGNYYTVVGEDNGAKLEVWNVTDASNPSRMADQTNRSLWGWARNSDKTYYAVVEYNGHGKIQTADEMVRGTSVTATVLMTNGGGYTAVDSDGTNFFFFGKANGLGTITVMKPNGNGGFDRSDVAIVDDSGAGVQYQTSQGIRAGYGLVSVFGFEGAPVYSWNVRLYKLSNGSLTPISLDNTVEGKHGPFFAQYYGTASPGEGYVHPNYNNFYDVTPFKYNGKTYIVVAGYGLGDVWEVRSGDSLNANIKALAETPNPNSRGTVSGPFYGDRQTFSSALTSGTPTTVNWSFDDSTTGTTVPGTTDIKHQFGGITNFATLPITRHATATNASDTSMTTTLPVTLARPAVRFGLTGTSLLFAQPDASSSAPIVTSDTLFDGSDGAIEGHYTEWVLDSASTKKVPSETFSVGGCGTHTLNFLGHYGQYAGTGSATASVGSDLPLAINGFTYGSRPFVISVQPPPPITPGAVLGNAIFNASVRATSAAADLPGGLSTSVTYLWELVGAGGTTLQNATGTASLGSIPAYSLDRSVFNTLGSKVRLTVTAAPSALSGACAPYAVSASFTDPLNAPDPTITKSGCDNAGAPCSFAVTSAGSQNGWAYAWTLTNSSSVVIATSNVATFAPTISTGGNYTVALVVTNAIGSATRSTSISPAQPLCSSNPTTDNTSFSFTGATCSSTVPGSGCTAGESLTFRVFPYLWTLDPACDTVQWDFGDSTATSQDYIATHAYAANGNYPLKLTVKGGMGTVVLHGTVTVGGTVVNPNPNPGPNPNTGSCPAQSADSAYIGFLGSQSSCTSSATACKAGESVTFGGYSNNYNFECSATSYSWNFGDNGFGSDRIATHTYTFGGTYHVTLTITNNGGTNSYTTTVQVGNGGPVTVPCGTLSTQTISFGFVGSGCTQAGGDCVSTSAVAFNAIGNGYDFSCGSHTFEWDYGDGSAHGSGQNAAHTYGSAGTYNAKLTVSYGSSSITISNPVHVVQPTGGGGNCPLMVADENVYIVYYGSSCANGTGNCGVNDSVQFQAFSYNYNDFACDTHTFSWDFADGQRSTEKNPTHAFTQGGTYRVKLTIVNRNQTIDLFKTVVVGNGGPAVPARHRPSGH